MQAEKGSKPTETAPAPKPKKTNRRVTFDDVEIERTSKTQKSDSQNMFDTYENHTVFDHRNSHPIYDDAESERESRSWRDSNFMIFDNDYRY